MNFLRYLFSQSYREKFSKDMRETFFMVEKDIEAIYNNEYAYNERRETRQQISVMEACTCISCQCCAA